MPNDQNVQIEAPRRVRFILPDSPLIYSTTETAPIGQATGNTEDEQAPLEHKLAPTS